MLSVRAAELRLALRLEPERERLPELFCWLSQDVATDVRSMPAGQPRVAPFELSFAELVRDAGDGVPLVERAQRANLNLDVFCQLRNDHGQTCRNQCGSAKVPLWELLDPACVAGRSLSCPLRVFSWGDTNADGANRDPEVENDKGTLELVGPFEVLLDGRRLLPLSASDAAFVAHVESTKKQVFMSYIGAAVAFCKRIGYRWEITRDVNA